MENLYASRLREVDDGAANGGNKMEQLSGVMIIVIIGGGVLTFVTLFIFAKRQIMRFTIRSRRGPHVLVGTDAKKSIRLEIERRLDCVQKIAYEPKLIWDNNLEPDKPFYWRMRAVDDVKRLEKDIAKSDGSTRHPNDSLRAFLLVTLAGTVDGNGQRLIHQYCDMYEHARHDPNEFGKEEYEAYHRLFLKLIDSARMLKSNMNSRRTSPSRTPHKRHTKTHSVLDPSRLRIPPTFHASAGSLSTSGARMTTKSNATLDSQTQHNSRSSLALGLQPHSCSKLDSLYDSSNLIYRKGGGLSYLGLQKDFDLGLRKDAAAASNDDPEKDDGSSSSLTVRKDGSNSSLVGRQQDAGSDCGQQTTQVDVHTESSFTFEQAKVAASNSSLEDEEDVDQAKEVAAAQLPEGVRLEDDSSDEDEILSITRYTKQSSNDAF